MGRAVARGLLRRKRVRVSKLGLDETSFQRRHEYVTIVTDIDSIADLVAAADAVNLFQLLVQTGRNFPDSAADQR